LGIGRVEQVPACEVFGGRVVAAVGEKVVADELLENLPAALIGIVLAGGVGGCSRRRGAHGVARRRGRR